MRRSPLFHYTTLFRSICSEGVLVGRCPSGTVHYFLHAYGKFAEYHKKLLAGTIHLIAQPVQFESRFSEARSEEHTSELQSHSDLVCRLLLEKKHANTV